MRLRFVILMTDTWCVKRCIIIIIIMLDRISGSQRYRRLRVRVSPGSPNCYNLKGEESQIRNSHNKHKNTVFNNF